jgi:hypothetical protein
MKGGGAACRKPMCDDDNKDPADPNLQTLQSPRRASGLSPNSARVREIKQNLQKTKDLFGKIVKLRKIINRSYMLLRLRDTSADIKPRFIDLINQSKERIKTLEIELRGVMQALEPFTSRSNSRGGGQCMGKMCRTNSNSSATPLDVYLQAIDDMLDKDSMDHMDEKALDNLELDLETKGYAAIEDLQKALKSRSRSNVGGAQKLYEKCFDYRRDPDDDDDVDKYNGSWTVQLAKFEKIYKGNHVC